MVDPDDDTLLFFGFLVSPIEFDPFLKTASSIVELYRHNMTILLYTYET